MSEEKELYEGQWETGRYDCVEALCCGFTFSVDFKDADSNLYSCPSCGEMKLKAEVDRLRGALGNVKKHMEISIPNGHKMSSVWVIANKALQKGGGDKNEFNPDYLCNSPKCKEVTMNIVKEYTERIKDLEGALDAVGILVDLSKSPPVQKGGD